MASLGNRPHEEDCGLCLQEGSKKEARHFCENCKSNICDSCKNSHKKFQDLRNHVIVPGRIMQHDDSSEPSDVTVQLSQLSTKPTDPTHEPRNQPNDTSEPEDVAKLNAKDMSSKPSTAISETPTISTTKPDDSSDSRRSALGHKIPNGINVLKDVKFNMSTKVNIRSLDDKHQPNISGCCFIPGGELILCDFWGRKVKLLDSSFNLKDVLDNLPGGPSDVSALDYSTVIVTVEKQLQFIEVLPSLKKGRVISVDKHCFGIDIAADQIYVSCYTPGKDNGEIRIYDFDGNLKKKIGKKRFSYMFDRPNYVSVSRSGDKIFVLDDLTMKCLTDDGKILYQFRELSVQTPQGLYVDDNADIVVCDRHGNTVTIITDRGTAYRTLLSSRDSIDKPRCLTYRPKDGTLVVGCADTDYLLVYKAS